jgi:hypothetical protein
VVALIATSLIPRPSRRVGAPVAEQQERSPRGTGARRPVTAEA